MGRSPTTPYIARVYRGGNQFEETMKYGCYPLVNIEKAIENGGFPIKNGDFPIKNGDFPVRYVSLKLRVYHGND